MPLITGTVYLFGQILSFALPVALLICFATFFYRQARKLPKNAATRASTAVSTTTSTMSTIESPVTPNLPPAPEV